MFDIGWETINQFFKSNDFASGGLVIALMGATLAYVRNVPFFIYKKLKSLCTVELVIDFNTKDFVALVWWLGEEFKKSKVRNRFKVNAYGDWEMGEGSHIVWKGGLVFNVYRERLEKDNADGGTLGYTEKLHLRFFTRNTSEVKKFIEGVKDQQNKVNLERRKPSLWVSSGEYWSKSYSLRNRELNSLYLREGLWESVIQDIEKFYGDKEVYRTRGVPYHRGYLLWGPPGTGKSTVILALSHYFNKNIYYLNLTKTDGDSLTRLLARTSEAIIVIEDIDCIKSAQERENLTESSEKSLLKLNEFLNALDGITSSEDYILIATTNYPDKIDSALKRPGRIDKIIEFKRLDEYQSSKMIKRFFPDITSLELSTLVSLIGVDVMSPADLQGLLLAALNPQEVIQTLIKRGYTLNNNNGNSLVC